ncbi:MAG: hypothetical protein RRA94_12790 [Bacteroidota bacterium]|nr:hypothetical protein [Bacteroidota bacterium]
MIRTSELHIVDTGLASAFPSVNREFLLMDRPLFDHPLESFVLTALWRLASFSEQGVPFPPFQGQGEKGSRRRDRARWRVGGWRRGEGFINFIFIGS